MINAIIMKNLLFCHNILLYDDPGCQRCLFRSAGGYWTSHQVIVYTFLLLLLATKMRFFSSFQNQKKLPIYHRFCLAAWLALP